MNSENIPKWLSIRSRVILIVASIFIILFALTAYSFNQKWNDYSSAKQSQDAFNIMIQASQLMHELQKERGISAVFTGSKVSQGSGADKVSKFKADMLDQRHVSDLRVRKLFELLSRFQQQRGALASKLHLDEMQSGLQELKVLRTRVESTDEIFNLFEAYSELITLLLNHASEVASAATPSELINEFNSYLEIIWLLERSGQERGAVNGILGQGSFSIPVLLKANGYISNQSMLLHGFESSAQPKHLTMLKEGLSTPISMHFMRLRQSVLMQAELNDLLNKLHSYIGYGGLIHTFKNYVIRGGANYKQKFHATHDALKLLLHEIKQLSRFEESQNQVSIIETTMEKYRRYLESIQSLRAKGKSIAEIDRIVRVNDQPAYLAIEYLRSVITQIDQANWWDSATARMDQIAQVGKAIEMDLSTKIQQNVDSSYQSMCYYLVIVATIFLIIALFAYYLIRRVAEPLASMAGQLESSAKQGNYNLLLSKPRKDEIGVFAEAFNNLMKEYQSSEESK